MAALFPFVTLMFLIGLSFNVTLKTMVQKAQESAVFGVATTAGATSKGMRSWIEKRDRTTLEKIRALTPRSHI